MKEVLDALVLHIDAKLTLNRDVQLFIIGKVVTGTFQHPQVPRRLGCLEPCLGR